METKQYALALALLVITVRRRWTCVRGPGAMLALLLLGAIILALAVGSAG